MNKKGEIVLIEDDRDDQLLMLDILKELQINNEVVMLSNGAEAFDYLNKKMIDPFLIISDINMPRMNGIELRDKMQKEGATRLKAVPFLFLTTSPSHYNVMIAYAHSVQGFFRKSPDYEGMKNTFQSIINYWTECIEPTFQRN